MKKNLIIPVVMCILISITSCDTTVSPTIQNTPEESLNVSITTDLAFARISSPEPEDQLLDVYKPERNNAWPVVVMLHGMGGTKEGYIAFSQELAAQGFIVFTANWPTWIVDMAANDNGDGFREMYEVISCAINFAHVKSADFGGNPSHFILVGHSYGASNGLWVALTGNDPESIWDEYAGTHGGPFSHVECLEQDAAPEIDAFIGIAGPYDWCEKLNERDHELWEIVSPYALLDQIQDFPISLIHGEQDDSVNLEISVHLNDALQEAGFNSKIILHDGNHYIPNELTISEILLLFAEISE